MLLGIIIKNVTFAKIKCNKSEIMSSYLKLLLHSASLCGELIGFNRENSVLSHYKASQKDNCLFLLSPKGDSIESKIFFSKNTDIIFLKSFRAAKIEGIPKYPYGFMLCNEGVEYIHFFYFYSENEENINAWIKCINKISGYLVFICLFI